MRPKLYRIWLRNTKVDTQLDIVIEACGAIAAKKLIRQILSDSWEVIAIEKHQQHDFDDWAEETGATTSKIYERSPDSPRLVKTLDE